MPACTLSFPFSISDEVRLKACPHRGGSVSGLILVGGTQRVIVRHFDSEGNPADQAFDATDLESSPVTPAPTQPKASAGAPPSAVIAPPAAAAPAAAAPAAATK